MSEVTSGVTPDVTSEVTSEVRKRRSNAERQAAYRTRREGARKAQLAQRGLPALPAIPTMPGHKRWKAALTHAAELVTMVSGEMDEYQEARSEEWQESDRGSQHEEWLNLVREIEQGLEAALETV